MAEKVTDYLKNAPILLGDEFENREVVFTKVTEQTLEKGWVTEQFLQKIIEREQVFPTGLHQGSFGIAIPHTDPECIVEEFISLVIPKKPVTFQRMDDINLSVGADFIFILGLNQPHQQLAMLQQLMELIQNTTLLQALSKQTEAQDIITLLEENGY